MTPGLLTADLPLADVATVTPRRALDAADRREMRLLLEAHFDGVTPAQFDADLDAKDQVLRIRRGERLVGFSTLAVTTDTADGAPLHVVHSGDTIVAPEAWGSPVLARGWIAMVRDLQGAQRGERWVWLLLSSGFRTYRFLPLFWRAFWPRYDAPTPPATAALLHRLATDRYGAAFDAARGIVRFARPQRLRGSLAEVPEGKRDDPHVAFFVTRNPGHTAGDELVCLADLSDDNLTAAGQRMVRAGAR